MWNSQQSLIETELRYCPHLYDLPLFWREISCKTTFVFYLSCFQCSSQIRLVTWTVGTRASTGPDGHAAVSLVSLLTNLEFRLLKESFDPSWIYNILCTSKFLYRRISDVCSSSRTIIYKPPSYPWIEKFHPYLEKYWHSSEGAGKLATLLWSADNTVISVNTV